MNERTVDDPVFGRLVWDGFQHEGWGGSFVDAQYLSWGAAIAAALPDDEDDEEPAAPKTGAQDFLSELLAIGGRELEQDEAALLIQAARDLAKRVDAYDGSLEPDRLRRAGRLKVVVGNLRETPPTAAQQAAWRAFRAGDDALAEHIAAALLATYRQQRPERVRWWKLVYDDSPDGTLPDVTTTQAMRAIVRPKEFRVYGEQNGSAVVAVVLESLWCQENITVSVREGKIISIGPLEHRDGISTDPAPEEIESPIFGRFRRRRIGDEWIGVFHSVALRGYDDASQRRYEFKQNPERYGSFPLRPGPPWETITGDFTLSIDTAEGQRPTPEQEAAFQQFNADPDATAHLVLSAILVWYQRIRPRWIKNMRGSAEEIESVLPDLRSPDGLLEIIQLQSVAVTEAAIDVEETEPLEVTVPFGPEAGEKVIILPRRPRKPGVAIVLSFHWEDEHGLAVGWRNGQIEKVGDWESVADEFS